jgi:hypothetical protein
MSTEIPPNTPLPPQAGNAPMTNELDVMIDECLDRTRRHVKWVDVVNGFIVLAIGTLTYLLTVAIFDHWLISGGLGFWGRLFFGVGFFAGVILYSIRYVVPPLVKRINPVFAAATIEKSEPTLKNSLVNFLLLRRHQQEVLPVVYQALEHRAADDLNRVSVDTVVDRAHLIRLGYILAALVGVFCVYTLVSPKNPIRSAMRVIWPWARIEAPTWAHIRDVQPGTTSAFFGDFVTISAEVLGLKPDEPVSLIYSTTDRSNVDQTILMKQPNGERRYQCQLPADKLGLQQNYEYAIAAGDAKTDRYRISVLIAPTIVVERVDYHYPSYTGLPDKSVERQRDPQAGDLHAIEGTAVTLHATANTEIKPGTAELDWDCTGRAGVKMKSEGSSAEKRIVLTLKADDPSKAEHESYQLRFSDTQGQENRHPIRHHVDVVRDLPPDVQILEPREQETAVPINGRLAIRLRAEDPDFALRRVLLLGKLEGDTQGKPITIDTPLNVKSTDKPWTGAFQSECFLEPAKLGLNVGDRVQFWAEAEDNKEPKPGRAATAEKQWIEVVAADPSQPQNPTAQDKHPTLAQRPPKPSDDALNEKTPDPNSLLQPDAAEGKSERENAAAKSSSDPDNTLKKASDELNSKQGDASDDQKHPSADKQSDKQSGGQSSNQPNDNSPDGKQPGDSQRGQTSDALQERINPDTDPGGAIQEILKDRQEKQQKDPQKQQQAGDESSNSPQQPSDQMSGNQAGGSESSDQQNSQGSGQKGKDSNQGAGKNADNQQGNNQQGNNQQGNNQQGNNQQGNNQQGNNQQGSNQQGNGQGSSSKNSGSGQSQQKSSGQGGDGSQNASQNASPSQNTGGTAQQKSANVNRSENGQPQGQGQQSEESSANDQSNTGQTREGQSSKEQPGKGQPKDGQQNAGQSADNQQGDGSNDNRQQGKGSQPGRGQQGKTQKDPTKQDKNGEASDQSGNADEMNSGKASDTKSNSTKDGKASSGKEKSDGQSKDASQDAAKGKEDGKDANKKSDSASQGKNAEKNANQGADKNAEKGASDASDQGTDKNKSDGASPDDAKKTEKPDADMTNGKPSGSASGGSKQPSTDDKSSSQKHQGKSPDGKRSTDEKAAEDKATGENSMGENTSPDSANDSPESSENAAKDSESSQAKDGTSQNGEQPDAPNASSQTSDKSSSGKQGKSATSDQKNKTGDSSEQQNGEAGQDASANENAEGQTSSSSKQSKNATDKKTQADKQAENAGRPKTPENDSAKSDASQPSDASQQTDGKSGSSSSPGKDTAAKSKESPSKDSSKSKPKDESSNQGESKSGESEASQSGTPGSRNPADSQNSDNAQNGNPERAGQPAENGQPGQNLTGQMNGESVDTPVDEANLAYANKQTDLALEYLRDQLAKEKPGLLERLGWTKDDAQRFLDRWDQMKQSAAVPGPDGEAARKELRDTLRSLGLQRRGSQLRHGDIKADKMQQLRDAGRYAPPPEWAEQFREYTRGIGSQNQQQDKDTEKNSPKK